VEAAIDYCLGQLFSVEVLMTPELTGQLENEPDQNEG